MWNCENWDGIASQAESTALCTCIGFIWTEAQDGFVIMTMPPGTKIDDYGFFKFLYQIGQERSGFY